MIDEKALIEKINDYCFEFDESLEENKSFDGYNIKSICMSVIAEMIDLINEQPKVGEWIPCSERLPKECKSVLITTDNGDVRCASKLCDGWFSGVWSYTDKEVIAWMPLPEPYSGGD